MTKLKPFLYRPPLLADETLASYLYRLAFANGHKSDIVQTLSAEHLLEQDSVVLPKRPQTFETIAALTTLEPYKIYWASVHGHTELVIPRHIETENISLGNGFVFPKVSETHLHGHIRSNNNAQFCPYCLAETGYQRRAWQLSAIAACVHHQCLLIDKCPQCNAGITVPNLIYGQCGECKFKLVEAPTLNLANDEFGLRAQTVLYYWAKAGSHAWLSLPRQPVRELYAIFTAIRQMIFAIEREMHGLHPIPELLKPFGWKTPKKQTPAENYVASATVIRALMDWPEGLFDFFRQYSVRDGQPYTTNLRWHFGNLLNPKKLELWQSHPYEFVYKALVSYLSANWPSSLIQKSKHFKKNPISPGKFAWLLVNEAASELNVTDRTVKHLVSVGLIRIKPETALLRNTFLLKEDVMTLKERWAQAIPLSDASAWLGVSENVVLDLIEINLLVAVRGPNIDGSSIWQIRHGEIEDLLTLVRSIQVRHPPRKADRIDLTTAAQMLSAYGFNAAKVIQLIVKRRLWAHCKTTDTLDKLVISRISIQYKLDELRESKEGISRQELASKMNVKPEVIDAWMKRGLLTPFHINDRGTYFKAGEAREFQYNHVNTSEAKRILRVSPLTIQKWSRTGRLQPVSGPNVDDRGVYLFRRQDLKRFMPENRLSLPQVARLLDVTRFQVRVWVKEGRIKPVSGPGIDKCGSYLFLKDEVNEFALSIGRDVGTP